MFSKLVLNTRKVRESPRDKMWCFFIATKNFTLLVFQEEFALNEMHISTNVVPLLGK